MESGGRADEQCWRCGTRAAALVCPGCAAPQPLDPGVDHFALLGLPRRLVIDAEDLERRYHAAARSLHPDRHQGAGARAQELSLAASAALNRAYRTLRDPVARGRYWLDLHGRPLGGAGNGVPPALAALVFDVQEKLAELRGAGATAGALRGEVEAARDEIGGRLDGLENALRRRYAQWDDEGAAASPSALEELRARLAEMAYLDTLHGDVAAALGG
ncbi:MAG TPA: DnaJ domain-containing protein [Candidatus Binatia bacterium]|nr:DnaJ domain-containing protein [Candidatus Binatia bacterium]